MSKLVMRIASLAAVGLVAFSVSAGDAEARAGGGGRGGPGVSSGIGRAGPAIGGLGLASRSPSLGQRAPGLGRLTIHPGRPIIGRPIIRPLPFPFPHRPHRPHRHRFHVFVGGAITPGCAVEHRWRVNRFTGQYYRVRVVLCPPAYY